MSNRRVPWIGIVLVTLLAGCGSGHGGEANAPAPRLSSGQEADFASAPLEPGDMIRLAFSREPELSGEYRVDDTGVVPLPLIGNRNVTGRPAVELKRELVEAYERELRNQTIDVQLLRRIRVLGAVRQPGLYHVDGTMNLADVVALAGGMTREGRFGAVAIQRQGSEIRSDWVAGDASAMLVRSGDQVVVPERSWLARNSRLFVGGAVSVVGFLLTRALF